MKPLKCYLLKNKYKLPQDCKIKVMDIKDSFDLVLKRFEQGKPFYFVRFGDGEFKTLMGENHRNYVYNSSLADELKKSFEINNDNYFISLPINYPFDEYWAQGVYKRFKIENEIVQVISEKFKHLKDIYHNPCIIHCTLVRNPEKLKYFLDKHIRPKSKMFIGGASKSDAEKLYGKIDYYIQTPFKHAYEKIDEWWPEVEKNASKVDLIIPSIGSSSNVVSLRLWNNNIRCYVFDFGSIIDAVGFKTTRGWIRRQGHKILKVLPKNSVKVTLKDKISFLIKNIRYYFQRQIN